jgi:hypothetical protein
VSKSSKAAIYDAFKQRVGTDFVQREKALLRIGFLYERVHAQGLICARLKDNVWDILVS